MRIASLWMESSPELELPVARGPLSVDVAVIGAGITGVTTALLLKHQGLRVALLEARTVGSGVTGWTTAKVSSNHGLIYAELTETFGAERAAVYAEAQEGGLALVAGWTEDFEISCDFRRREAWTYQPPGEDPQEIEDEVGAALAAGLAVTYEEDAPLPFETGAAIRYAGQAEFHPRRYVQALAARIPGEGSHVFEHSRVTAVTDGRPCRVETEAATIQADRVVVATHYPILDRGLFFPRLSAERSYVVAAPHPDPPEGMFLSTESPAHSIRTHPDPEGGGELLLVGGEGHKAGQSQPVSERYAALARWGTEQLALAEPAYAWASQDPQPADGLPYVGALTPLSDRLLVATGFRKWGLTNGTAAAMILADRLTGVPNPWAETFDSNRFRPPAGAKTLVKENVNVGLRFVRDRLQRPVEDSAEALAPGQGGIVEHEGERVGGYRDEDGALHLVSPVCTHLGCWCRWNDAERTWDCPCHGSRFAPDGSVLEGPAVHALAPRGP